jgi:hypothetical protein
MAYEHSDGSGIAHYSFLRVTSKGENVAIVLYMKPSIVDKEFLFQLEDDQLFSRIIFSITHYEL